MANTSFAFKGSESGLAKKNIKKSSNPVNWANSFLYLLNHTGIAIDLGLTKLKQFPELESFKSGCGITLL
jgi:bacillopeptidase F (M6 metalloprotease family)